MRYVIQVEIQRGQRSKVKMQNAVQLMTNTRWSLSTPTVVGAEALHIAHTEKTQPQTAHDARWSEKQTTSTPKCKIDSSQEEDMILAEIDISVSKLLGFETFANF